MSLVFTTISLSLYALLPLMMTTKDHHDKWHHSDRSSKEPAGPLLLGPWVFYCATSLMRDIAIGINTCLSDSFAVLQAEEYGTTFGRIIVWGTFGWASSGLVLSLINQWRVLARLMPGLIFGTIMLTIDVIIVSFWRRDSDFKLDVIPISAAQTLTGSTSSMHKDPTDYLPLNEAAHVNLGTSEKDGTKTRHTKNQVDLLTQRETFDEGQREDDEGMDFSIRTINSELERDQSSRSPSVKQTDLEKKSGNPYESRRNSETPIAKLAVLNPGETWMQNESEVLDTSFRLQLLLLCLILKRRKALIRYLILFMLSGFFMSMHWNYFFLYLEQIYYNKFELISALSMVGQSICGELPFFILSRKFIDFFGRSHTLSLSVLSIGIRFLLYAYMLPNVNMFCIIVADCLQGPNYGLFYVVMTEIGLEFSYCDEDTIERLAARGELDRNNKHHVDAVRLSLRSTIQSVAFACYEGIGVGLGSLAGGWLAVSYGFKTLWVSMAICSIFVGLVNILIEINCREQDPEEESSERREFAEARRSGTLRKVASPLPIPPVAQVSLRPFGGKRSPEAVLQMRVPRTPLATPRTKARS